MYFFFRTNDSTKITIGANEEADIWIYTGSTNGASFQVLDENKRDLTPVMTAKHTADAADNTPTKTHLTATGKISGPLNVKVKGTSDSGGYFSSAENFLVVCNVSKKG